MRRSSQKKIFVLQRPGKYVFGTRRIFLNLLRCLLGERSKHSTLILCYNIMPEMELKIMQARIKGRGHTRTTNFDVT